MMLILDTNVVWEIMRPNPEDKVLRFLQNQPASNLAITAITVLEIGNGLHRLPEGNRRSSMEEKFHDWLQTSFVNRIFPFDESAARCAILILARRRKMGRPLEAHLADVIIAAIATSRQCSLATRNIGDFEGLDLDLVNPWSAHI